MPKKTKKTLNSNLKKINAPKSKSVTSNVYLLKEQEEFYRKHPNAKNLIATFLLLAVLLAVLYFSKYGFVAMPL